MSVKVSSRRGGMRMRALALACVLPLLPSPASAQRDGIAGTWRVEFPRRVENDGSGDRVTEVGVARVTFEIKGDSIFGRWQSEGGARPSSARRLVGTMSEGRYHLTAEPYEAMLRGPDGDRTVKLVGTYEFTIDGDSLTGTQQMQPQTGGGAGPKLPLKGSRDKG